MQTYERETGPRVWLRSSIGLTGVVFEDGLPEGEDIAQHLSTAFGPVLFVHSYEGALWGYKLFLKGVPADEFCTRASDTRHSANENG